MAMEQDMETIRILQEQYEKESKKANIPVPPIVIIEDYDKFVAKDFKPPTQYQKHKSARPENLSSVVFDAWSAKAYSFVHSFDPVGIVCVVPVNCDVLRVF